MEIYAEHVSADLPPFGVAARKRSAFLGKPGQNSGQHGGVCKRRHTGTHSAQEAAERMCGTQSMVDMAQAYQDWAKGAFERMMADGIACQEQIIAATGALTSPSLAPSEKGPEPARPETKSPARAKAP